MQQVKNYLSTLIKSDIDPFKVPWGLKDVVLIFIFFNVLNFLPLLFIDHLNEPIYGQYISSIFIIAFILFYAKNRFNDFSILGVKKDNLLQAIINGLVFGFVAYFIVISTSPTLYNLIKFIPSTDMVFALYGLLLLVTHKYSIVFFLLAPISEELLMRGVMYSALRKKVNILLSALICAIIFVIMHVPLFDTDIVVKLFDIFIISILMSLIYEKYKSIFVPIVAHISYNVLIKYSDYIINLNLK